VCRDIDFYRTDRWIGTLHPKHIILATGHSGEKNFPEIEGMKDFGGDLLCHSSEFPGAKSDSKGKKAVVVGCCNSGHDIAHDFVSFYSSLSAVIR
jgi:cation diffusion facilitator CzcD-associated flavoprotein CzcO